MPADDSGCSAAPGRAPGPWLLILGALFALRTRRRPAQHGTLRQSAAAVDGDALQVAAGKDGRLCARLLGVALGVAVVSFLAAGCGDDGGTTTQLVCDDDAADTGIGTDVACTPTPETCNGMDDNCDGVVDNIPGLDSDPNNCGGCGNICDFPNSVPTCDFGVCRVVTCEPGFSNADGVAENGCEFPCETSNDGVEICDGIDNDCNGILDDGFDLSGDSDNCGVCGRSCVTDNVSAAECIRGRCTITECADGFENANGIASDGCESTCVVTNGGVETCDGIDNDCDGRIDNRLFDFPPPCLDLGVCRGARAVCRGEEGYVCAYPTLFTEGIDAVCDGLDNDCDGEIDEDFFGVGEPCDGDDSDLCEDGILSCNADGSGTFCREVRDNIEICDGEDNDCDGEADEGFDLQTDSDNCGICGRSCSALNAIGACEAGVCRIDACEDGFFDVNGDPNDGCEYACEPSEGGAEVCDGLDNDCNGIVDDGIDLGDSGCLSDGVCSSGRPVCDPAEGIVCLYPTTYEEGAETLCDGLDNNCDGNIDESFAGLGEFCDGDDDDLCADGVLVCGDGGAVCTDDADSNVELCDGADNDCDGDTDEGFDLDTDLNNCGRCGVVCNLPNATAECDSGVCSIASCDEGFTNRNGFDVDGCEFECTPSNGGVEICDGLDNDCDGQTDEGLTPPDPDLCDGPGVCAGLIPRCQGADGFQCVYPAVYEEVETTCDNLDNDCDGSVDEATDNPALANKGTTCQDGLGICLSRGIFLCSDDGTSVVCSAEAGAALPNEICNGLDDDCDGDIDEGIPRNSEMVQVTNDAGTYWIDRWEASRPDATATERGFDDAYACSRPDVLPWNNLSWDEAAAACAARGRRLCTDAEWTAACSSNGANAYPYGDTVSDGTCNDGGVAVQPTGSAAGCVTPNGIFDQSGNVAEWADCENPNDCRIVKPFFGGSYSDDVGIFLTCPFRNNGAPALFSSSVGFRCCDD